MQMRTYFYLLIFNFITAGITAQAASYTPGKYHNYSHAEGTVPKGDYQYSMPWLGAELSARFKLEGENCTESVTSLEAPGCSAGTAGLAGAA
jgi:hypothetical protein